MSIKSKVGIGVAAAIFLGLAWLVLKTVAYEGDRREAEWRFLTRASHSVHGKPIPDSWTTGVFVSTRSINGLLAALKGATISFDPAFKPNEDTRLTLKDIKIDFGNGFPSGALSLLAESNSRKIQIEFDGEAGLIFEGVETRPGSAPAAKFRVELLRLEPHLSWQWFTVGARGYAGELLTTGTAIALS